MRAISHFDGFFRLLAGALLAVAMIGLAGCDGKDAKQELPKRPVLVTAIHYAPQAPERSFVGTIKPRTETELGFRVGGKVAKRLVEVGQRVEAGQTLAVLDQTDLKLQAEQAEAEHGAAKGVLAQAIASEHRSSDLRAKGWATDAQMDQARAAADEARSRFARAERSVELTRNALSYATLEADGAGVVAASLVEPGQVVAAGQAAFRLARIGEKEAVVAIPETLITRATKGLADVTLWSEPGRHYAAKLREVAPLADPATRTFLAKFSLPDADDRVALGMTATLTLTDPDKVRVARVPLSALFNQGGQSSLYVVDTAGEVKLKPVAVKAYESEDVLIADGVAEGEQVVTLGVQKLDPTEKVRVVSALTF